jgi:Glycosyl hydrolases family 39
MEKGMEERFRFLARAKKSSIIRILCLLAICLVLSITILHGGRPQPSKAAGSADVTVDFGSRQNTAYPIPPNLLGIAGIGMGVALQHDGGAVPQANFRFTKLGDFDYMSQIFPTATSATNPSQQNWSQFDMQLGLAVSYHLQPMITLAYTPGWLQPQNQKPPVTNPCLTYQPPYNQAYVKPTYIVNGQDTGVQMWAQLAQQFVAHVDQQFPQVQPLYEIWNQPDGASFLCMPKGDQNADQDRVTAYKSIFAAAAPLMKQQASKDGVQIKIGGPALVFAMQKHLTYWLPNLLNDPSIYPYIDFFSYHRFLRGTSFNGGSNSFVANAQDPMFGVDAEYAQVAKLVQAGKQPNAATTPIYIDEYNMDSCKPGQCKNDPTYAPLTNALFLADVLNTVNDTKSANGPAKAVPAGLGFYTWNIKFQSLCMFGILDAKLDCSNQGTIQPYPQYYSYELFGGANYLNLPDGGYVANSATANPAGIYVTGFYTRSLDNIVIINTTATNYPALNVFAQNPGNVSNNQATVFTVAFNKNNPSSSISTQQVNLVSGQNGYTAAMHVPAYTVVALSIAA